jgi:hypothetical protein
MVLSYHWHVNELTRGVSSFFHKFIARLTKKHSGSDTSVTASSTPTSAATATEPSESSSFSKSWKLKHEPVILDEEEILKRVIAKEIERHGPLHVESKHSKQHRGNTPALASLVHTLQERKQEAPPSQ